MSPLSTISTGPMAGLLASMKLGAVQSTLKAHPRKTAGAPRLNCGSFKLTSQLFPSDEAQGRDAKAEQNQSSRFRRPLREGLAEVADKCQ